MSIFRLYDLCVCIDLKISMLRKPLKFVLKTGELKCRNLVAQEKGRNFAVSKEREQLQGSQ